MLGSADVNTVFIILPVVRLIRLPGKEFLQKPERTDNDPHMLDMEQNKALNNWMQNCCSFFRDRIHHQKLLTLCNQIHKYINIKVLYKYFLLRWVPCIVCLKEVFLIPVGELVSPELFVRLSSRSVCCLWASNMILLSILIIFVILYQQVMF